MNVYNMVYFSVLVYVVCLVNANDDASKQGKIQFHDENKHLTHSVTTQDECVLPLHDAGSSVDDALISVTSTCEFMTTNEASLKIAWKPKLPIHKKNILYYVKLQPGNRCFPMGARTEFQFDESKGFKEAVIYNITVVAKSENHTVLGKGKAKTEQCPKDFKMYDFPTSTNIDFGSNFTFHCKFVGSPKPTIRWQYTNDLKNCKKLHHPVTNDKHIIISNDQTKLNIVDANEDQQGCYECHVKNDRFKDKVQGYLVVNPKRKKRKKGKNILILSLSLGGIVGLLFAAVLFMVYKYIVTPKQIKLPPQNEPSPYSVYISHCCKGEKNKNNLLLFASLLQSEYGFEVILDLTSFVEINNVGGMCVWIHPAMERADKIMVILSKDYLETLEFTDTTGDQSTVAPLRLMPKQQQQQQQQQQMACKVHAEFSKVKNIIYHERQRTRRLLVVSDGVDPRDFPSELSGRSHFPFPTSLDADDDTLFRIAGVLMEQETVQLGI